jgi:hypothetical protein
VSGTGLWVEDRISSNNIPSSFIALMEGLVTLVSPVNDPKRTPSQPILLEHPSGSSSNFKHDFLEASPKSICVSNAVRQAQTILFSRIKLHANPAPLKPIRGSTSSVYFPPSGALKEAQNILNMAPSEKRQAASDDTVLNPPSHKKQNKSSLPHGFLLNAKVEESEASSFETNPPCHEIPSRCKIYHICNVNDARGALAYLEKSPLIALDLVGGKLDHGSIEVVQLAAMLNSKIARVFLWDFARVLEHDRSDLINDLKKTLSGRTIVIHNGQAAAHALQHHFKIKLALPVIDTRLLFFEWVKLSREVHQLLQTLTLFEKLPPNSFPTLTVHLAPPASFASDQIELNQMLEYCGLYVNPHQHDFAQVFNLFQSQNIGYSRCIWQLKRWQPSKILEHLAFQVDQLPQAGTILFHRIFQLQEWMIRFRTKLHWVPCEDMTWSTAPLPLGVTLVAMFSPKGERLWRLSFKEATECEKANNTPSGLEYF